MENDNLKQIKNGALISYVAIAISLMSGLLYTPWMIEKIGVSNYGLFTLSSSLISIFLIDFGISEAVSRFISKYNVEGKQESVNDFLGLIYKLYIMIDVVIFIVLVIVFFLISNIFSELTPLELERFKVVYIISATFSIISLPFITLNGILISYEQFISLKKCDLIHKLFILFVMVFALLMGFKLYALVVVNVFAGLLILILKFHFVKRLTPVKVHFRFWDTTLLREIFGFSIWATIISISQRFIFNITPSILGSVAGSKQIAIFGISSTLEGYCYLISGAINGMFLPKICKVINKKEDGSSILPLMIKVGRFQFAIMGLLMVGFTVLGKEFITLWMGSDFRAAYYGAIVLILPGLLSVPTKIADITIIAMNKVRLQSYVYIALAIINIALSYTLSQLWGAFGASLSICIVYFISYVVMNIIYYNVLHINVFSFFKECYFKLAPPVIITLVIGFAIKQFFEFSNWFSFIIKGVIIVVLFAVLMWKMSMNDYEKSFVYKIFRKNPRR